MYGGTYGGHWTRTAGGDEHVGEREGGEQVDAIKKVQRTRRRLTSVRSVARRRPEHEDKGHAIEDGQWG